jgi:hypothetical protein
MYRAVEDSKIHKLLMQPASLSIVSTDSQATNFGKKRAQKADMTFTIAIKVDMT